MATAPDLARACSSSLLADNVNGQVSTRVGPDVGLVWFRRDLRLADNPALVDALGAHDAIVPLFVWDPRLTRVSGAARMAFLLGCLEELNRSLGGRLVLRTGDPRHVVPFVADEVGARSVWCAQDYGPYGVERDVAVANVLDRQGVQFIQSGSSYAVSPGGLLTSGQRPYQVFTPYSRSWLAHGWSEPIPAPSPRDLRIAQLPSEELPKRPAVVATLPQPGEESGRRRLEQFVDYRVNDYDEQRDRPDLDATSRLSPYLKFGCIHPRQILQHLDPTHSAHNRFRTELCWREFYADVLFHRPDSARAPFRHEWDVFVVDNGEEADARFEAWSHGKTGYPIVDAGMRQLLEEGWIHNRVRMIVASFLVKDLHLDWRRGAEWFMQHLVDGDLASNQHGWQWVAGTGTDAAPYFRIFNPVIQGKRFDPHGDYIRRWVPELASLPERTIHEPRHASAATLLSSIDYPPPMVDHAHERDDALLRYRMLRAT